MNEIERDMQAFELRIVLNIGHDFLLHVQKEMNEQLHNPAFQTIMAEKLGYVIHHGNDLFQRESIITCDFCGSPFYEMWGFTAVCGTCLNPKRY